jgi:hypothetical protein
MTSTPTASLVRAGTTGGSRCWPHWSGTLLGVGRRIGRVPEHLLQQPWAVEPLRCHFARTPFVILHTNYAKFKQCLNDSLHYADRTGPGPWLFYLEADDVGPLLGHGLPHDGVARGA